MDPPARAELIGTSVLIKVDGVPVVVVSNGRYRAAGTDGAWRPVPRQSASDEAVFRATIARLARTSRSDMPSSDWSPTVVSRGAPAFDERFTDPADIRLTLPDSLNERAADAAVAASTRLRLDRRLAPAMGIEVLTPKGRLKFRALNVSRSPLEARFSFSRDGRAVYAALRLKTPKDPLALRVGRRLRAGLRPRGTPAR
jgi:hypothetical protein